MYIQTIGPRESPKFAMKLNKPTRMRITDMFGFDSFIKNPTAIIRFVMTDPMTPPWRIVFLPNLVSRDELIKQVATC